MNSKDHWDHIATIVDGERFDIDGVNVWDCDWKDTGERIQINDPLYGRGFTFSVYEINTGQATAKFAAGEFSNCVWGIYRKDNR